ncbi:MAG: response regulator [Bacteriovoracaceae bacterium]|jgi:CheY-like chemotaxis protein|nr:response regulator [Bacteriovoracaceae bacterium]
MSLKVLTVDDDPVMLELYQEILPASYKVVVASNAQEALFKLKNERFDLVLTDYKMPKKSGVVFIKEVREFEQRNKLPETKFILISGDIDSAKAEMINEVECEVLNKPFAPNELQQKIDRLFKTNIPTDDKIARIAVKKGVKIVRMGELARKLFIVESGSVGVYNEAGEQIAVLEKGQTIGEMSAIERQPSAVDVLTLENSVIACVEIDLFNAMFSKQPEWFQNVIIDLSRKLRNASGS